MDTDYEAVVAGGGAAGLSAAVALARSRRTVLVVDDGEPRNAAAEGVHNFLSREGIAPRELLVHGRAELRRYGGVLLAARATRAVRAGDGFAVSLDDGSSVSARRVVVATGLVDELPDVEGLRERWGRDVLHCPYCHGWEVRDQAIAVLGTGAASVHQALLFGQLSDQVTLLANDVELDDESHALLAAARIEVVPGRVEAVRTTGERLSGLSLADGRVVPAQVLVVAPRMVARSEVLSSLGIEPTEHTSGMGAQFAADDMGQTSVPGVYVAGNAADIAAQVMGAAAAGTRVGAAVNRDLILSDLRDRMSA